MKIFIQLKTQMRRSELSMHSMHCIQIRTNSSHNRNKNHTKPFLQLIWSFSSFCRFFRSCLNLLLGSRSQFWAYTHTFSQETLLQTVLWWIETCWSVTVWMVRPFSGCISNWCWPCCKRILRWRADRFVWATKRVMRASAKPIFARKRSLKSILNKSQPKLNRLNGSQNDRDGFRSSVQPENCAVNLFSVN